MKKTNNGNCYPNCYIGLGSNLGNPVSQIHLARKEIAAISGVSSVQMSLLYRSKAMTLDNKKQPDYINAALSCQLAISPQELLEACQAIEIKLGRKKVAKKWQARLIDIDILLVDEVIIHSKDLMIPHPEISKRPFVLLPLLDIAPDIKIDYLYEGKKTKADIPMILDRINDQWDTHQVSENIYKDEAA